MGHEASSPNLQNPLHMRRLFLAADYVKCAGRFSPPYGKKAYKLEAEQLLDRPASVKACTAMLKAVTTPGLNVMLSGFTFQPCLFCIHPHTASFVF